MSFPFTHIQSTLVILTSFISNNRLSVSENPIPVLTWKSNYRYQNIVKKKEEIAPNFSSFPQYFNISLTNFRDQITYSFVQCGCSIYFLLNSANLICRGPDISKYFSPLDFEITRVDCMLATQENVSYGQWRLRSVNLCRLISLQNIQRRFWSDCMNLHLHVSRYIFSSLDRWVHMLHQKHIAWWVNNSADDILKYFSYLS